MMRMNARTQWKMLIQQQGRLRRCLPSYSSVPVREEQSFEQERASKLEHQGMLKTTHHLLGQQRLDSSHVRDARLVLNYWTSPRVKRHHPGHEGLASQVFDLLLERAEPSTFEQVIKTDTSTVGGLVYLVEHLLYSFRLSDLSSFLMMGSRTEDQRHLLESLKQATNALTVMHDLLSEQASRDDMMAFKVLEVNLWYKRAWFLNEFRGQLKDLSEDDWVIAFDRVRTAQECLAIMTGMAEELCQTHNPGPMVVQKIYTMLISGWVYSGLPNAMDMSLELLNELEEKPELGELSPIPYNAIMYLCAVNRNAELAWQFWKHMTAPDSGVEPDAATLASLLLTFVRTDQLDRAIELLNHVEGQVGISSTATNTTCYNVGKAYLPIDGGLMQMYLQQLLSSMQFSMD
jgi:pentatricopeptide repeat protein